MASRTGGYNVGKVMEVIGKKSDPQKNTCKLTLIETNISLSGSTIGSDPNAPPWDGATNGTMLSKEYLTDLNNTLNTKFDNMHSRFGSEYNSWINQSLIKVGNLQNFYYTKSDLDYANKYIPNVTPANNEVLEEIVYSELELNKYKEYADTHMAGNNATLKEWSKTKPYKSIIDRYTGTYVYTGRGSSGSYSITWRVFWDGASVPGVTIRARTQQESAAIDFEGLPGVANGTLLKTRLEWEQFYTVSGTSYFGNYYSTFRVDSIGSTVDEGKVVFVTQSTSGGTSIGTSSPGVRVYTGGVAKEFETNKVDLPFLKSRILL